MPGAAGTHESVPFHVVSGDPSLWPSAADIREVFAERHKLPRELGWSPARRLNAGYFLPAEIYEATVAKHVSDGCAWVDVGGGHAIFPQNPDLAARLAARCRSVVAIDPDPSVHDNRFTTERYQSRFEDYAGERRFHLATLRMVAEHVDRPAEVARVLHRVLLPGGLVIVLTVNRWSPVSVISRVVPFGLHHPIKRLFWGGHERDTFPVHYRMNTRRALRMVFEGEGFTEAGFAYLDDLSTFGQFKWPNAIELGLWSVLRRAEVTYPENCLLGIYRCDKG